MLSSFYLSLCQIAVQKGNIAIRIQAFLLNAISEESERPCLQGSFAPNPFFKQLSGGAASIEISGYMVKMTFL